jgi:dihydrofolate reductase
MSKVRVANFSLSVDGFGAGPAQDLEHPLGENGMELHEWLFNTRTFRTMQGGEGGAAGIDDSVAARGMAGVGAWILGRARAWALARRILAWMVGRDDGIREALDRALNAAHGKDVQVGGGASTIRQYLREGLIDELRLAIAPVLLGKGEPLFEGMSWRTLGYRCKECVAGENATHVTITKQAG